MSSRAWLRPNLSQVDTGCNYRGEVSQPLRHVPAMLSALGDVWALWHCQKVSPVLTCAQNCCAPMKIGLSFPGRTVTVEMMATALRVRPCRLYTSSVSISQTRLCHCPALVFPLLFSSVGVLTLFPHLLHFPYQLAYAFPRSAK